MKLCVFPYHGNIYRAFRVSQVLYHFLPVRKIRFSVFQTKGFQNHIRQLFPLHGKRSLVKILHIQILKNVGNRNITEKSDLFSDLLGQRIFAPAYQHIGLDSHSLQFFYAGLGRLCFHFPGRLQIRDQRHMDQRRVVLSYFVLKLPDRLQKGLAFYISYCSSYLNNGDSLFIRRFCPVKPAFDLICNMRDHLNSSSPKISVALFLKNGPVNFSGCHIGIFVQAFINKTFIMSQIQVCLRSVVCYEDLAVLYGIHGPRVNVYIGIKFLHGHLIASGLQKSSQGGRRDSFSQTGYHSSCHKNILYCHYRFPPPCNIVLTENSISCRPDFSYKSKRGVRNPEKSLLRVSDAFVSSA